MLLLDLAVHLETMLGWIKEVRFLLCAVVGVTMVVRIAMLWMSARDKRQAIEETLWWVGGLVFLAVAPELIDELFDLLGAR
ncbi:MAG: hypothetical protein AAFQ78_01505 [Bacteroidota bacterium]